MRQLAPTFLGDVTIPAYQDKSPSERFADFVDACGSAAPGMIDVSTGISDWSLPPAVQTALKTLDWSECSTSRGSPEMVSALASWLKTEFDIDVRQLGIAALPTCGSKEGIAAATAWVMAQQRSHGKTRAVIPEGSYYAYEGAVELAGGTPHEHALGPGISFAKSMENMSSGQLDTVALVFYPFPANPFGPADSADDLQRLLSLADRHGFMVLSDECMLEVTGAARPPGLLDVARRAEVFPETLIVSNSLSKRSFASSLRAGCLVASESTITAIGRARNYLSPIMQAPAQAASALLWLDRPRKQAVCSHIGASAAMIRECLTGHLPIVLPACGQYAWIAVADDIEAGKQALIAGVKTMPSSLLRRGGLGATWPSALRLTMSVEHDALGCALDRLVKIAPEISPRSTAVNPFS